MKKLFAITACGVLLLDVMVPTSSGAEWLYAIAGPSLVRADLNGLGLEVITSPSSPHCFFWDFDIHPSGAPYIVTQCSTPTENTVIRLRPDYVWEELLRHSSAGIPFLSIELSDWLNLDALYYGRFGEIRVMTLDRSLDFQIVAGSQLEDVLGLDVDSTNARIYWVQAPRSSSVLEGRIMRAHRLRPNEGVEVFVSLMGSRPNDVSVDEEAGMVYWSNATAGMIQRASVTDGNAIETVLHGLSAPAGIAVHAASRKIYWAEEFRVRRSNLDGTVVEDVLNLPGQYVYRIAFGGDLLVGARNRAWGELKRLYR